MGFGDVNLAFFMGLFLGWPNILVALFSAFLIGAIIGIGLIILGKKKLKSQVPFGPFLIIGTFIALFWGQNLINWYLNFLLSFCNNGYNQHTFFYCIFKLAAWRTAICPAKFSL